MKAMFNYLGLALLILVLGALTLVMVSLPGHAAACMTFEDLSAKLSAQWDEAPVNRALAANGMLFVVFADSARETWTAAVVTPENCVSLLASGTSWETLVPVPQGTEG